MLYQKAEAEIVKFDEYLAFLAGSLDPSGHCNDYTDSFGDHCGTYDQGVLCLTYTFKSGTKTCNDYDGTVCRGFNTHGTCNNYDAAAGICYSYEPRTSPCTHF